MSQGRAEQAITAKFATNYRWLAELTMDDYFRRANAIYSCPEQL